jgi:hypothetical protein
LAKVCTLSPTLSLPLSTSLVTAQLPLAAFSSIMFAFAGASTFPTIQADMKDRTQFPKAAVVAMLGKQHLATCDTPFPSSLPHLHADGLRCLGPPRGCRRVQCC